MTRHPIVRKSNHAKKIIGSMGGRICVAWSGGTIFPGAEGGQHEFAVIQANLSRPHQVRQYRRPETASTGQERRRGGGPGGRYCLRRQVLSGGRDLEFGKRLQISQG